MNRGPDSQNPNLPKRNRWRYTMLLAVVIGCGLLTRTIPGALPEFTVHHVGDALWAVMIFLLAGIAQPRARTGVVFLLATAICFAVECSQLYQAEWTKALRGHPLGALVLGHGFLWTDLVAYSAGTSVAAFVDSLLQRRP